jgi:hypothetical protein
VREPGVYLVHVMKTGGTSLNRMFHAHFGVAQSWPASSDPKVRKNQKFDPKHLTDMDPQARASFRYVSLHTGAWVAEALFPDLLSVTVLRDPVERTISHLRQLADLPQTPSDLEAIYLDPVWHPRLVDHQTQVFAATEAEFREQEGRRGEYQPDRVPEQEWARVREGLWAGFATTISAAKVIDEAAYMDAEARLDRIDEVGVTERLGELVARVGARLGSPLPEVGRDNVSSDRTEVTASLRARIADDSAWDRRLYERALARASG